MGKRSDEVGRDPLNRRDQLGEGRDPLAGEAGFDPATDAFRPDAVDPARFGDDEVEVTRVEIERTRADMSETANAIQRRLSPENLKEQAKDRVREATVSAAQEAGSGITDTIRENPVPWALTGIGLGWLLMNVRRQREQRPRLRRRPYYDYPSAYDAPYDYPPRYYDEREPSGPSAGQETLNRTRDRVEETAGHARDRVEQSAAQVRDKTGESPIGRRTRRADWPSGPSTRPGGPAAGCSGCCGRPP
jgi:hypothetical protein